MLAKMECMFQGNIVVEGQDRVFFSQYLKEREREKTKATQSKTIKIFVGFGNHSHELRDEFDVFLALLHLRGIRMIFFASPPRD